jgi:hypothetical protein
MNLVVKRTLLIIAALAVPLMVQTVWMVLLALFQEQFAAFLRSRWDFLELSIWFGMLVSSAIAGFMVIVRAFRGRWWLAPLGVLYFGTMPFVLLYYTLVFSITYSCYGYEGPPGGCWP